MHIDDVRLRIEMIVPHIFQQHGPGDYLSCVTHQIFKQPELARLQLQLLTTAADRVGQTVKFEIGHAIDRVFATLTSPTRPT